MKNRPRIGLLPLYLELYDESMPDKLQGFSDFTDQLVHGFEDRNVEVVRADVSRLKPEFARAVSLFEDKDVDCVVTLHLAYSPSLESLDALADTKLPILILDTTMDTSFGPNVQPDRIMYNHGIHGVMDMASMLRRRGKPFRIVAGHIEESDVIERAAATVRAAYAARCLRETRALRVGRTFDGMGDFSVDETVLSRALGPVVDEIVVGDLLPRMGKVTKKEIEQEMALDHERFECEVPDEVHRRTTRVCLALRALLDEGDYGAFSMNFLEFKGPKDGVDTVPFLEASKSMARGIGYAGEGDVLTASLVGALAQGIGTTTFTEIFCPDWHGNSIFLSHMGEINPDAAGGTPRLVEKPFPFTPAENPAILACAPRPGRALFVDIAPGQNDTFALIVSPVDVLEDTDSPELRDIVRGWIRPSRPVGEFLEEYSRWGGTHHSALVLDASTETLQAFAAFLGIECCLI